MKAKKLVKMLLAWEHDLPLSFDGESIDITAPGPGVCAITIRPWHITHATPEETDFAAADRAFKVLVERLAEHGDVGIVYQISIEAPQ